MQEIEKLSILFTVLEDLPFFEDITEKKISSISITDIKEKTGMHFETVEKYLEFIQSSQELSYLIKIVKKKHSSDVFKFPNSDSNKILNIKIDTLNQQIHEINKKLDQVTERLNHPMDELKKYYFLQLKIPHSKLSEELKGKIVAIKDKNTIRVREQDLQYFKLANVVKKEIKVEELHDHQKM